MDKEKEFVQNFALELTNRTLEEREEIGRKYYQQLQAKEQECERLKDIVETKLENSNICDTALNYINDEYIYVKKQFDQLKAEKNLLQQESDKLKAELKNFQDMAKKGLDEFKDVGGCWGCGLQLQLNQNIQDIKQLKSENEELKEENAKARMEICNQCSERDDYNIPCKQIRDLDYGLQLELEENEKLKQALQKIKEIAQYDVYTPHTDLCIKLNWVKKKISEVIKDEE